MAWQVKSLYMEKYMQWRQFYNDVTNAINNGYNQINVGFYQNLNGPSGAIAAFTEMPALNKNYLLQFAANAGAKVKLAVGGPTEFIELIMKYNETTDYANKACSYAKDQGYTGVDFYMNLSGHPAFQSVWANNGSYGMR